MMTMAQWLQYYRLPYAVIATKRTRCGRLRCKNRKLIGERLKLKKEDHLFLFSALTRMGRRRSGSYISEYYRQQGVFTLTALEWEKSYSSSSSISSSLHPPSPAHPPHRILYLLYLFLQKDLFILPILRFLCHFHIDLVLATLQFRRWIGFWAPSNSSDGSA